MQNGNKKVKGFLLSALIGGTMMFSAPTVLADDTAAIKERLLQIVPGGASQATINKTAIDGLYQVQLGLSVVYISADGKLLLNGDMIDLDTKKNLTNKAKSAVRKIALDAIPESSMIVYPASNGKHTITIFSDIDCPYCTKLHKEIPELNKAGINVRYLAYPRAGMGSPSYHKAVSVWCAKDPAKSMDDAMAGLPPESKKCENPVRDHMVQAQKFEVNGTPNMIFDNGDMIPGYAPAKEIIKMLNAS